MKKCPTPFIGGIRYTYYAMTVMVRFSDLLVKMSIVTLCGCKIHVEGCWWMVRNIDSLNFIQPAVPVANCMQCIALEWVVVVKYMTTTHSSALQCMQFTKDRICNMDQCYWVNLCSIFTYAMAKVMFSSLSDACLFVCLSVCLSVCLLTTLRKNDRADFHEIIRIGGTWYKEQLGTFSWCSI